MTPGAYYCARVGEILRRLYRNDLTFDEAQEEIDFAGYQTDDIDKPCRLYYSHLLPCSFGNQDTVKGVVIGCGIGSGLTVTSVANADTMNLDN